MMEVTVLSIERGNKLVCLEKIGSALVNSATKIERIRESNGRRLYLPVHLHPRTIYQHKLSNWILWFLLYNRFKLDYIHED